MKKRDSCQRGLFSNSVALLRLVGGVCLLLSLAGCGAAHVPTPGTPPPSGGGGVSPPPQQALQFGHVVLLVEENHSFSEVIGNSSMPYLNSLASNYGLATQYYANLHPSISDYFMLTTGQPLTLDDAFNEVVDDDNVVRELNARGKTWKAYLESLPAIGYLGGDQLPYVKRHNPFAYLSDVAKQPAQASKMVPFTEFAADLNGGQLANFSFIAPDVLNDAHTGTLQDADLWLHRNIDPLINSPVFRQDGLLIITFDEGNLTDMEHGGGRVATIIVSPKAKKKFASTTFYQHQSTLRLILQVLGITKFPGLAANAPAMNEFFQ